MDYKDKSLFYRALQKEKKAKLFHWVCILILEMLKFEKQHMVNTCSSKCYYWQIDAGVFRREGNKHKHTGLVGGETGPVFLEVIWLYQSKAVKPFLSFLLRNSETRANV